jgi:hypothetical protein
MEFGQKLIQEAEVATFSSSHVTVLAWQTSMHPSAPSSNALLWEISPTLGGGM